MTLPPLNPVYAGLGTTIFTTMSALAMETGAINLGQGFPETDGFPEVREAAARALMQASNQYAPMKGQGALLEAVADFYGRTQSLTLDPAKNVLITSGATEALAAAVFSLIAPGDEVIVFEPHYDAYAPLIARAGGVVVRVRLNPPDWRFSEAQLAEAFSPRTRMVMVTTPNNPTTRLIPPEDWALLARFCVAHQACVVSDEVWEQVVFDGARHHGVLNAPELAELGVKIGSAGKLFALTGWKVGFVCASERLVTQMAKAHQFLTFATPPMLQTAVAFGLRLPDSRFAEEAAALQRSRDLLRAGLETEGFQTLPSEGTYFLNIDLPRSGIALDGQSFALRAVQEAGVATIPLEAFCAPGGEPLPVIRLCFAKSDATLNRGIDRLRTARRLLT
ncbi:aminotransferase [Asticcacaulis sp. AND118]|uniref:aminotransferase n=1 Tax=Asticcacaulis sp. AND118 TaxID=2840468 RepID=UPI001CFF881D|nr:aminotransferase [Asticcacaulis sp. AND118]UDF05117.1 aminotransferase [Asticcacaulis sp. AND118]